MHLYYRTAVPSMAVILMTRIVIITIIITVMIMEKKIREEKSYERTKMFKLCSIYLSNAPIKRHQKGRRRKVNGKKLTSSIGRQQCSK